MIPNPFQRPPPQIPSQETVDKWEKGAKDPDSLTFDDRQKILRRQPYDASNAFSKKYTGLNIDELLQKATTTDDLTELEASLVMSGTTLLIDDSDKEMADILRWPTDIRQKYYAAYQAFLTETDRKYQDNAKKARTRRTQLHSEASKKISNDDRKNITWCNRMCWMSRLVDQPEQPWGFVCIRTSYQDEFAWNHFQEQFKEGTKLALTNVWSAERTRWGPEKLEKQWKIQWIDDPSVENASLEDLCSYFRKL